MNKYKIAVIGFGHIGRRHATIIHEYPETELAAIIDIDPLVTKHDLYPKNVPFFESIDAFIEANIACDVVNICTPNFYHIPYAIQAMENQKHVVIEKPMGLNKAECEKAIEVSHKNDKRIFVVKQNRYSPPSKWLKEVVDKGLLGDIYLVQNNCFWNRDERYYTPRTWRGDKELDGGVLFTQFSHFIDIMHWIFGDVKNVKTVIKNFSHKELTEFPDSGISHFEFIKGGIGSIQFSTSVWDQNMESSITVIGSKGSVKIGGQYMDKVEYCHIDGIETPKLPNTNPPNDYGPFKGSAANHHYVIENLVKTLNGETEINANAQESMKVVEIIEKIYAAGGE